MRNLVSALAAAVCMAAAFTGPATAASDALNKTIPITAFTLDNGMQVVVIEDHRAPVVTHMVWYRVGSADETAGFSGIAHFLEHLMFKGTENTKPGEFSDVVAQNGGRDNAFTSQDYTGYLQRIAADRLETMMRYEADRMRYLTITDEQVRPEREVVLEERAQRVDSRPGSRLNEQMNAALYLNHPYGRPIIGWEHEIRQLNRDDALAFYRQYYTPANAILIVAGDADPGEVRRLAEKHYGPLENTAERVEARRLAEPPHLAERRVLLEDPRAAPERLRRLYLTPSYSTAVDGEDAGLALLSEILGGGSTSRLYTDLVVDRKIAVDAGAFYQGSQRDYGEFGVYAVPAPGVTLEALEEAVDAVIAGLISDGVNAEELKRAQTQLIADAIYAQDSQGRMARNIGVALTTGSTVEDVIKWPETLRATDAETVRAAARAYLTLDRSVTGLLRKPASAEGDPS